MKVFKTTFLALLGSNFIFNFFLGSCLSFLWGMLNAISSIIILNLISITIPGVASNISKVIFSLTQLEIIPSDLIIG
jgi:hypothetical protein